MTTIQNDVYERGFILGQFVKTDREQGGNYDARWDFSDEAKAGNLTEFMNGFNAGFGPTIVQVGESATTERGE